MKPLLSLLSCTFLLPAQGRPVVRESEQFTIQIPGAGLHGELRGSGPPVVLLSGGPGFGTYLQPVADALAAQNRCILLDQRGTGGSKLEPIDEKTVTVELAIADLETVRTSLKLERWSLLGHSWGGMLAMAYACAHPDRVDKLVLVASGGLDLSFAQPFEDTLAGRATPEEAKAYAHWSNPEVTAKDADAAGAQRRRIRWPAYFYSREKAAEAWPAFAGVPFSSPMSRAMFADLRRTNYDLRPGLAKVHCPTLIVHGRQDAIPETVAYEIRAALPQAELRFVEKSGHMPWLEQPEATFALLRTFLAAR
jgi:proline iminopeptidase